MSFIPPTPHEIAILAAKARAFNQKHPTATTSKPAPIRSSLRRRLSPQTIDELKRRYVAGEHSTALSKEYGVSKSGLVSLLRSEGVALRRQPLTDATTKRAVRLYERGYTIQQVADQVNSSYGAIRKMLHAQEVRVRETCVNQAKSP